MCRNENGMVRYAPLCIHSFRLIAPRKLLEAQLFNQQYHSYAEIDNVPDRLRWCRHHMGLMQKEVAKRAGISRSQYIAMETGKTDCYERGVVDKLAALFGIPVEDLLDGYNRFLYQGQGRMIQAYRERLGLSRKAFAKRIQVHPNLLWAWEKETKRVSRRSWERYFKE